MNRGFFAAAAAAALCLRAGMALAGAQEMTRAGATSASSRAVVPARHVAGEKRDKKAPAAKRAPRPARSADDLEMPQLG